MTKHSRREEFLRIERKDADDAGLPPEIKKAFGTFMGAFGEFKEANDARLKALESKSGSVDTLVTEKTDRINAALDTLKKDINDELAKLKRPVVGDAEGKAPKGLVEFKAMAKSNNVTFADDTEALARMTAYKAAYNSYLRKGIEALSADERKELSVGVATEGGFLVMPERSARVIERVFDTTPMREICGQMTVGTNRVEFPVDRGEASSGWVGEQTARGETATPEIGEMSIDVHEQYAMPFLTQNMIDDSSIDIEAWLDRKVADKFARVENTAFITGNGVKQPLGILSGMTPVTTADASRDFGVLQYVASGGATGFASSNPADYIIDLITELNPAYRQGAVFLAARRTISAMRKLKDGQGLYLAGPSFKDGALVESVFGFRVVEGEDMPAVGANNFGIAFGNFSEGYLIVDRQGIRQLRDPFTTKGKVKVYTTKRVGGRVVNSDAIKLMKFATS